MVEAKVSFPLTAEEDAEESDAARRPTLFLESVQSLADAIQSEARAVSIRLAADRTRPDHLRALRDVLRSSPGTCSVSVVIELANGAEAVLAVGSSLKVAPSDAMLAGLERLFGANVAELR